MSDVILLLRLAQSLAGEARQIRMKSAAALMPANRVHLIELAVLLEAEARKLELQANRPVAWNWHPA
jgi:hypothetical protein